LQEVEFIGCYVGVALEVCGTVLANYESVVETIVPLDLDGSDARGDATCKLPRVEQPAPGVDFEGELFELRVVVECGHWVCSGLVVLVTSGTMITLDGGMNKDEGRWEKGVLVVLSVRTNEEAVRSE
jgi:hypothetical protein